ncbi:MAG: hypothetical protein ACLRX2_01585, partial [Oscillospiraceae bacterium]
ERMKQSNPDLIDYDKNMSALREVQPSPVKASDIAVRVGTSWIDKELYKEFFCELIGMPYYYRDGVELYYNKHDGSWRIDRTRVCAKLRRDERNERLRNKPSERIPPVRGLSESAFNADLRYCFGRRWQRKTSAEQFRNGSGERKAE